jgi:hypothetical protein
MKRIGSGHAHRIGMGLLLGFIAAGCGGGGAPPPPPPHGGGTGAFGVVTVNGLQKLYLPLPDIPTGKTTYQLAVIDAGIAGAGTLGAPARLGYVDLGSDIDVATATGGDSTVVVAASTTSNKIWFIDPATDKVTATLALDASYGTSDFSGGGGYVTGIAMDSRHRAVLSVWNGYIVLDTSSHTIVESVLVAPSENFGFDATDSRIIAPFYDCGFGSAGTGTPPPCDSYLDAAGVPISEGLNIIDLNDSPPTVYTYQFPTAVSPVDSAAPVGGEPDSAAIDTSTGIAVIPSESGDFANVIDLAHATFDKAAKSATGTASIHHTVNAGGRSEGVSIDPVEHIAFFEGEASSDIGVIDLSKASTGTGAYLHADMPDKPSGGTWSNMFDPHGIAVTTGILDGHPVGFVVDVSDSPNAWVARIDLQRFLALTPSTPGMATSAEVAPAVTFLDASTAK